MTCARWFLSHFFDGKKYYGFLKDCEILMTNKSQIWWRLAIKTKIYFLMKPKLFFDIKKNPKDNLFYDNTWNI